MNQRDQDKSHPDIPELVQPDIPTARLVLRRIRFEDSVRLERLAGDYDVARMTMNIPHPYEPGMAAAWIATLDDGLRDGRQRHYAIAQRDDDALIGGIGLVDLDAHTAVLGYWLGKPYWNRGYATEAAEAIVDLAFNELGVQTLRAEHLEINPASGRVMQKIGMIPVATEFKPDRDGAMVAMACYELRRPSCGEARQ